MFGVLISAVLSAGPAPGTYVREGGSGLLQLDARRFTLQATGGNAHVCELEGTWKGTTGTTTSDLGADAECRVSLEPTSEGLQVKPLDDEKCRAFCGARASFDGHYLRPAKGCSLNEVKVQRDAFKKAYDAKRFAEAVSTLKPVLDRCERVIDLFEVRWIRNDLAIAQHHAGDDAACLKTLEPLDELRDPMSDEDAEGGEPAYAEVRKRLAKATRTNAKKCGYAGKPK